MNILDKKKNSTSFNYYKITTGLYIILTMYSLFVSIYLSIPLLLYGIITNKKGTPLFIALFFSILGYSFTPPFEFDLYRHYESYEYYLQYNEFLYPIKDFYLSFLFLIGKNLSLKKEFLYFI
ncbi:O181 family O-antigen polymerase, partial [Escherichia coli]|nr:O181 family O-antigen polymerase [Escherichia coli]